MTGGIGAGQALGAASARAGELGARHGRAAGARQQTGRAGGQALGVRGRAGQATGARQRRGRRTAEARQARGLGAGRAGWPRLCTWCTRPVFGPVRLGIFPESIFGHYS